MNGFRYLWVAESWIVDNHVSNPFSTTLAGERHTFYPDWTGRMIAHTHPDKHQQ